MTGPRLNFYILTCIQVFTYSYALRQYSQLQIIKKKQNSLHWLNKYDQELIRQKRDRLNSICPDACKCEIAGNGELVNF